MYYPTVASAAECGTNFFLIGISIFAPISCLCCDADLTCLAGIMAPAKAPEGHFTILYFAAASTFTGKTSEHLPAPVRARDLFAVLEERYPDIRNKVLSSSAMTVNMEYVDVGEDDAEDADKQIGEGDEVAIIPPVSSG